MICFLTRLVFVSLLGGLAAPAVAQTIIDSYKAQIAPVDRRNSSGTTLTDIGAILAQDRANVHRFGTRQPADEIDGSFSNRDLRAAMPRLLSSGSITGAAQAAIRSGGAPVLQVTVWGTGRTPDYVTVDIAGNAANPSDPQLTTAQLAQAAGSVQAALNARGFDAGPVDGQPGRRTRDAISAFQRSLGKPQTGILTQGEFTTLTGGKVPLQAPSFDCARAGTPTEYAICGNGDLAALDQELAAIWSAARASAGSGNLTAQQREWLASRNACGADANCLATSMRSRITALSQVAGLPVPALASAAAPVTPTAPEVTAQVPAPTSTEVAQGLIYVDGRLLWNGLLGWELDLPQGPEALQLHQTELARRLSYSFWDAASDDLEAGLNAASSGGSLRQMYDILPPAAQQEAVTLGLQLSQGTEDQKAYCAGLNPKTQFSCATQRLETEFDRRRFQQGLAGIIARTTEAEKLPLPIPVQIFCPLGQIDRAYDFETSTVNWAQMMGGGNCSNPNARIATSRTTKIVTSMDLANAMPETSPMEADVVEALARSYQTTDVQGRPRITPLILAFEGELTIARTGTTEDMFGMVEVTATLRRTGPVSLRSSASPLETIRTFEAPSENLNPSDAVDLSLAANAYALIENAPAFDAPALSGATEGAPATGRVVRLQAHRTEGPDGTTRLSIENFFLPEDPAKRVAAATGQPLEHVAWTQLIARSRVPNTELVLIFPAPYAEFVSEPVTLTREQAVSMIAEISAPMQMQGAAGPALVARVRPRHYEVQEAGIGGARRVVARPAVAEVTVDEVPQVFLPSAWWFAVQSAELQGVDIDTHLGAVLDRANMFRGDTFARLDAITTIKARLAAQPATDGAPWVAGGISFGPYDIERKAWPVQQLSVTLPAADDLEARIARRVQPDIQPRALFLPMEVDAARKFQEVLNENRPLEFYARIDVSAPTGRGALNVAATLQELLIFQAERSRSQPMQLSPRLDRASAIATVNLPASALPAPDKAAPSQARQPAPVPAPEQAPIAQAPVEQAPVAPAPEPAPAWPAVPDIDVALGTWDLLGLRTGMTLTEAEKIILERGGVQAAFERQPIELDPSIAQALRYQRLYVASDGTEAISLAAPGPEGPVLAIMRRIQLPRGDLPFEAIKGSIIEKYGPPAAELPERDTMARVHWVKDATDPTLSQCRAQFVVRGSLRRWRQVDGIGTPDFNLRVRPAPWDWQINDLPVDYVTRIGSCGDILSYQPESAEQTGAGAAFTMMMVNARALREMDDALSGVPEAETMKIDF